MTEEKKERLVISTRKSLYDPVEIEIDEQVYQSKKLTRNLIGEVRKIEQEIAKNPDNDELRYRWINLVFDVDPKILDQLEIREVQHIYFYAQSTIQKMELERAKIITKMFETTAGLPKGTPETKPKNQTRPGNKT